ncbi:MAG: DUF624 domain-containing protein [Alkalibacterium sp.]|nr:DUF624 domain-containing protein [Alkalibacterium sp.]
MVNFVRLNTILVRILKLSYLNLLWILGTLLGLVIFGIGPSTAAVFSIIREWFRGNDDLPVLSSFIKNYKAYFKESLLLILLYGVVGMILVIDYVYMTRWEFKLFFGILLFFYIISAAYIFPILVHYDLKSIREKIKYSFLVGFSYLQYTLVMFVIVGLVYFSIARVYPALITFFGISFLIFIVMKNAFMVFSRIEKESVNQTQLDLTH